MTEKKDQESVVEAPAAAPQKQVKQIPFDSQMAAYKWLQLECPKEYHFAVGTRDDTGEMIVLVSVLTPPPAPVEAPAKD